MLAWGMAACCMWHVACCMLHVACIWVACMVHLWCTHVACMLAKCSMYTACRCTLHANMFCMFACLHVVCCVVACCVLLSAFFYGCILYDCIFLWLRVACLCVHMVAFGISAVTAGMAYRVFLVFNRLQISSFGFFRHFFLCYQSTNIPNVFPKIELYHASKSMRHSSQERTSWGDWAVEMAPFIDMLYGENRYRL